MDSIIPSTTWQIVKELEEKSEASARHLGEVRATLLVNYGPDGKATKGLVTENMTPLQMLIKVCEHYIKAERS